MIDRNEFVKIKKELESNETERENLLNISREIIAISKKIIYAVHSDNLKEVASNIAKIKKLVKDFKSAGCCISHSVALQEYAEAVCYYEYVNSGKLLSHKDLDIDAESYLLGICDMSGELVRRALNKAVAEDTKEVVKIKNFIDGLYREFLNLGLRGSELRKKADMLLWNLKKLEDILFSLKIR